MKSLTCFIGLKNPLMLFAGYITYPTQTTAPFEQWLNKQVVNYINTVATKIVADINAHVFFNAPDPQSTHQQEPVFRYLDQTYNLYQGSYPADIHNSLTPSATTFIKESIKRLNDASSTGGILTLDTWVTEIVEQLTYSNATLCCADYIFQLKIFVFLFWSYS